jgi:GNAT superfamily N-acetyltransferase
MLQSDLASAQSLRELAGWNQTDADWRRLLRYEPAGCFVAEAEYEVIGTATAISYGRELGWVGMLLVHPSHRRRGVGKALLRHSLKYLEVRKITCAKLDATPLGQPLYERLGFREEWRLTRWAGQTTASPARNSLRGLPDLTPADMPSVVELDRKAFGTFRGQWLELLARESGGALLHREENGAVTGYGLARLGSRAFYLGPVVATSAVIGTAIVEGLMARAPRGTLYWDVPDQNKAAVAQAENLGFVPQRELVRMYLGENTSPSQPLLQFGIADPSVG